MKAFVVLSLVAYTTALPTTFLGPLGLQGNSLIGLGGPLGQGLAGGIQTPVVVKSEQVIQEQPVGLTGDKQIVSQIVVKNAGITPGDIQVLGTTGGKVQKTIGVAQALAQSQAQQLTQAQAQIQQVEADTQQQALTGIVSPQILTQQYKALLQLQQAKLQAEEEIGAISASQKQILALQEIQQQLSQQSLKQSLLQQGASPAQIQQVLAEQAAKNAAVLQVGLIEGLSQQTEEQVQQQIQQAIGQQAQEQAQLIALQQVGQVGQQLQSGILSGGIIGGGIIIPQQIEQQILGQQLGQILGGGLAGYVPYQSPIGALQGLGGNAGRGLVQTFY